MCPGRKTKKDPTKEMGREEALEQIGKKKENKTKILRKRKKKFSREKDQQDHCSRSCRGHITALRFSDAVLASFSYLNNFCLCLNEGVPGVGNVCEQAVGRGRVGSEREVPWLLAKS